MGTITVNDSYSEGQAITVRWTDNIGPGLGGGSLVPVRIFLTGLNGLDISADVDKTFVSANGAYSNITGSVSATATFNILNDQRTEGTEYFVVSIGTDRKTISILDTSLAPTPTLTPTPTPTPTPTRLSYSIVGNSAMNEGETNFITFSVKDAPAAKVFFYVNSEPGPNPFLSIRARLDGLQEVTLDSNGNAIFPLSVINNRTTDGLSVAKVEISYIKIGSTIFSGTSLIGIPLNITINDTSKFPNSTFTLSSQSSSLSSNSNLVLDLNVTQIGEYWVNTGDTVYATISGVDSSILPPGFDQPGAVRFTLDSNGNARTTIPIGKITVPTPQTLQVTLESFDYINWNGGSRQKFPLNTYFSWAPVEVKNLSALVNDTSLTQANNPRYSFSEYSSVMNEGQTNGLLLQTTGVAAGTVLNYSITGITADRLTNGLLSGTTTVDSSGQAYITLDIKANNRTDGPSTAAVTIGNNLALTLVTILDTSLTPGTTQVSLIPKTTYVVNTPNLSISGTNDVDVVSILKTKTSVNINISGSQVSIVDNSGTLGTSILNNVERLKFSDTNVALDVGPTQNAGSVYMLYKAAFNRPSDASGMGYWLAQRDSGKNIVNDLAQGFVNSPEFIAKYGANPSNADYVNKLYQNVLGRAGESGGVTYWNQELDAGRISKAAVLVQFATLAEGASLVANEIKSGIIYQQWVG